MVQRAVRGAERPGSERAVDNDNVSKHYNHAHAIGAIDADADGSEDGGWGHAGYVEYE